MIPIASLAAKSLGKRVGKVSTQAMEKAGTLTSYLIELFKNHRIIKIFQKEEYENAALQKIVLHVKYFFCCQSTNVESNKPRFQQGFLKAV